MPEPSTRYRLSQFVPWVSYVLAGVLLVGGVAVVLASPSLAWLGIALAFVGAVLGAYLVRAALTSATLTLEANGLRVVQRGKQDVALAWAAVQRVSGDAGAIVFHREGEPALTLRFNRMPAALQRRLLDDIRARMDADRGYGA